MTVEVSVLKNAEKISTAIDNLADAIESGGDLQPATADTLGGVKIGEGISVTSDGTISAAGSCSWYPVTQYTDGDSYFINKSWNDLKAALQSGKIPYHTTDFGEGGDTTLYLYICTTVSYSEDNGYEADFISYGEGALAPEVYKSIGPDADMQQD